MKYAIGAFVALFLLGVIYLIVCFVRWWTSETPFAHQIPPLPAAEPDYMDAPFNRATLARTSLTRQAGGPPTRTLYTRLPGGGGDAP
jgi:hypothetical protein